MRFTDNPLERMMTQKPKPPKKQPAPDYPPGHPCRRCPFGQKALCMGVCYKELDKERDHHAACDR